MEKRIKRILKKEFKDLLDQMTLITAELTILSYANIQEKNRLMRKYEILEAQINLLVRIYNAYYG